jgi:ribosomal-protein-alanine N-acetyltransferase
MTPEQLTPDHAEAMAKLHAAAFPAPDAWSESALRDLVQMPTALAYGVWTGEELAAMFLIQYTGPELEILTIATDPTHRRQGLARRLLRHAERELRPAKSMLDVAADNSGAIAFYESLGFFAEGRRKGYYKRLEGDRVDAILMTKG